MTTIRNSGRKDCEQMKQALEQAKLKARQIVDAEKAASDQSDPGEKSEPIPAVSPCRKAA